LNDNYLTTLLTPIPAGGITINPEYAGGFKK
jgi:hypothetical protein